GFARKLETAYRTMWHNWCETIMTNQSSDTPRKTFLHVGCGAAHKDCTTAAFAGPGWNEIRLDIDPTAEPDVIGSITDMAAVAAESVDAIFSSHNIEHLYAHEVPVALGE